MAFVKRIGMPPMSPMSTDASPALFEPFRPEFRADPYEAYRRLRIADPIHYSPLIRKTLITRHADAVELFRHPNATDVPLRTGATPLLEMMSEWLTHRTHVRGLIARAFTPRAIRELRPRIEQLTFELIDALPRSGAFDLVTALCYPLPLTVIAELLGIPHADRPSFRELARAFARGISMAYSGTPFPPGDEAALSLRDYFDRLLRGEGDDTPVVAALRTPDEAGVVCTAEELTANLALLLFAGHETTAHQIGTSLLALLRHPEEAERLIADPSLIECAVEEILRFEPAVQLVPRVLRGDVELSGRTLPAGTDLAIIVGATCRDPARFERPDVLDIGRRDNPHHAFGGGTHTCLGNHLARLELQTVVLALVEHRPRLRLATEGVEFIQGFAIRGLETLNVRFD